MRTAARWIASLAVLVVAAGPTLSAQTSAATPRAEAGWVCPPCGHADDDRVFREPGACPVCGMALARPNHRVRAAILVFDGVQIIDFTGPYEVFGQARFDVYTVSSDGRPITTAMGMSVNPHHSFANAPAPDLLLVPGGTVDGVTSSRQALAWVRKAAAESDHVLSVCNGAFILAEAGLLDGLSATTFYGLLRTLARDYPAVEVVRDRRFVDNGKIVTSAGLSSGIDAALHVVSKVRGPRRARELARHLEYDWDPASTWARGALADYHLPRLAPPPGETVELIEDDGDRDRWAWRWSVRGAGSAVALARHLAEQLSAGGWTPAASRADASLEAAWRFRDEEGRGWLGRSTVAGIQDRHEISIQIERDSAGTGPGRDE